MSIERDTIALGDVALVRSGYAFKSSAWTTEGIPVVKISNVKNGRLEMASCSYVPEELAREAGDFNLNTGDILIAMTGYVGDVARVLETDLPVVLNQRVGKFIVKKKSKLDEDFLFQFLSWSETRRTIESLGYGSAQPNVSPSLIHSVEMPLPPIAEQRSIASVLGALDDKIELNRRMNATLEAMAQAVFKEWFVARNAPGGAKEEWEEKSIGDLADINSWTLGKNDTLDVIDYIEISEVNRGDIGKVERYARGEEPGRAKRRLRNGDTVMSTVRPDRGAYFLSLKPAESLIASSGFAVITPTKAPWSFVHAALTQPQVLDYLGQQADGGAYPAVRPEIIGAYPVAWPNDQKVLDRFHELVAPLYERADHNRNESRTLAALRDTLLPKLMRGEVRVKENSIS